MARENNHLDGKNICDNCNTRYVCEGQHEFECKEMNYIKYDKETSNDGKTHIKITKGDGYMCIEAEGHHKEPIVCSAISAIMQTTEAGLKQLANSVNNVTIEEREEL